MEIKEEKALCFAEGGLFRESLGFGVAAVGRFQFQKEEKGGSFKLPIKRGSVPSRSSAGDRECACLGREMAQDKMVGCQEQSVT